MGERRHGGGALPEKLQDDSSEDRRGLITLPDSRSARSAQPAAACPTTRLGRRVALTFFLSEFLGTGLLVLVGLSAVVVDFAPGSPVYAWLDNDGLRRSVTGFLFGTTGALIAFSPVGKVSGAHINPVVTLTFLLQGTMRFWHAGIYLVAQLAGAVAGALPLLAWGAWGRSVQFGATTPGVACGPALALVGEAATTFIMILCLLIFLGHRRLRAYTPLLFPVLYAIMVYAEAPVSGTSTNPARSLGPAVIADLWRSWWVYWIGPTAGALLAVAAHGWSPLRHLRIEVAKVYHFRHDPHGVFRSAGRVRNRIAPPPKLGR